MEQLDWFDVKSGVKQGCNMSGFLFLLVVDWVIKRKVAGNNTGIRWKLWSNLDDLDFADNIALISSTREQLQQKVTRLNLESKRTGLMINKEKTKVIKMNAATNDDNDDCSSFQDILL